MIVKDLVEKHGTNNAFQIAIKLLFETIELTNMNSYRELCYVRGCNEKEY